MKCRQDSHIPSHIMRSRTHLVFLFTFVLVTDLTFLILDCLTLSVVDSVANLPVTGQCQSFQ